ncbi:MAG: (d)CMP kinase [Acidobacteria bacterium]|nr:(d)CMP kinase [Acidobacteriota bacterium]
MAPTIVAIDGPSGVGKTTTSKLVAERLRLPHIDTGAMYRALALKAKRHCISFEDAERLAALAASSSIDFVPGERPPRVILDGEDVSDAIRTPEISMGASTVSSVPAVRRALVRMQQELGARAGGVLEGRDIGTKVFPETPHKFFLDARPEVRAERRYRELAAKGAEVPLETVAREMEERDRQDSTRADSPLTCDESYVRIDTSDLSIDGVVEAIVGRIGA